MKPFVFQKSIELRTTPEKLYHFHADTHNLPLISPSFPKVELVDVSHIPLRRGDTVHVRISVFFLRIHWHIRISDAEEPERISDLQTMGPFRYWHHHHLFRHFRGGVIMTDRIEFIPPGGLFGLPLLPFIYLQLRLMFTMRHRKTALLFVQGSKPSVKKETDGTSV